MMTERLRSLRDADPFVPFAVRMTDGRTFRVPGRDHLSVSPAGGTALVFTDGEAFTPIDVAQVADIQAERVALTPAAELWRTADPAAWEGVLERYWELVRPENLDLERSLNTPKLDRLWAMDPPAWYRFLRDEYFRWKYTAPNRYATTTRQLSRYEDEGRLDELDRIRRDLLSLDPAETKAGLRLAKQIHGLGTAGASGLLALMYPAHFGTVDQFVVKALREVDNLPEAASLARMNPEVLTVVEGVLLVRIMQRKAAENNARFGTTTWTPRRIDMALWAVGR